ncbi:holin [Actinoalloteichus sp. GBA129-24]|uniref:holin n=1 Tax=Actinoalloteichus sp. GBA129-24 TaxID=1612551 RepID=UPI00095078D5|nr:holin [Actinoalloteichus sp. GBA129-24]APU20961.1 hypothetical protein UA75_14755 [Actinoalloteichus sp. GBA129-24]APU24210.1 hypothetical protein UA75_31235 [Actinoalloteichus sp. GBA129-24]
MTHAPPAAPVEAKVKSATIAATLTGLVLGLITTYLGGPAPEAIVTAVTALVGGGVSGLVTFAAGWTARHTPRVLSVEDVEPVE